MGCLWLAFKNFAQNIFFASNKKWKHWLIDFERHKKHDRELMFLGFIGWFG
jgi:hypothetical protein